MRKILIGLGAIVVLIVAAALIVPFLIPPMPMWRALRSP